MNRRILIGCGAALLIGMCVLLIGIAVIFSSEAPENVEIELTAPESVPASEPFAVEIQITNVDANLQTLDSIDISTSYLENIRVESVSPPASDEFEIPLVQFYTYTFQEELGMFESMTVVFEMVGEEEGTFEGEVDVCINEGSACETFDLRTTIGVTEGR
jgi:hypothetical protein